MTLCPRYFKVVNDRLKTIISNILGKFVCLVSVMIGTYTGSFTITGPIMQVFANILESKARNHLSKVYMVLVFTGQLTGTTVGNKLYVHRSWSHVVARALLSSAPRSSYDLPTALVG